MTCLRTRARMLRALCVLFLLAGAAGARADMAPERDARDEGAPKSEPGKGIHFLYLVRHGSFDHHSGDDDRSAKGLNALGHEQARLVGQRLAELPVDFDRLICSEYLRAVETADVMGGILDMTPIRDSLLNECTPTTLDANKLADHTPRELAECDAALQVAWRRYFVPTPRRDTYDVLVCHGNVIRWMLMKALGADTKHWANQDAGNAALTIIAVRPDGSTRLVTYSDVGHLPVAKQTWSGRAGGWTSDD